jgi:hypothetical protein
VVTFTPRPLYLQGKKLYPLERRLGGLQSRSERGGKEKEIPVIFGNHITVVQPVACHYTDCTITTLVKLLERRYKDNFYIFEKYSEATC